MNNYADTIDERILSQYQGSPIFISFLQAIAKQADELEIEIADVIDLRWVETASGTNLDILGELVGIRRQVVDFIDSIYFGFDPDPTALGHADLNDPTVVAGRYRDSQENPVVSRLLGDDEYRSLITAKILKNTSNITANQVLLITRSILKVMFVSGDEIVINIIENGNAHFSIVIEAELDGSDQAFIAELDLIPRPAGVRIALEYIAPPLTLLTDDGLILYTQDNLELEIQS